MDILENPDRPSESGGPTRPIHITPHSSEEDFKKLENHIRDSIAIEGKWQSYISNYCLVIPEELRDLFQYGGVITVSTERHLLLFGNAHWSRMNKMLSKEVGLSPVNNEVARHIYSHMHRFNKLNEDGTISLPLELVDYAGLKKDVAIIGLIYHAEVHDKASYLTLETPDKRESMLARFRKIRFN
jgi:DNA-binding transcriptional regulator/RsmH inhibitor MraZ